MSSGKLSIDFIGEVEDAVLGRRSIRHFRVEPIPREDIEDVLRLALWAPSPHNSQPWRFSVLTGTEDKDRLALAMAEKLAEDLAQDTLTPDYVERQIARSRTRITSAPAVILCSLAPDGLVTYIDKYRSELEWQMAVQSVGAVLQTLFLCAHSRGIGTCWMAAPMYCQDAVRAALGLDVDLYPQALVLMGYPAAAGRLRDRRSFDEVVEIR